MATWGRFHHGERQVSLTLRSAHTEPAAGQGDSKRRVAGSGIRRHRAAVVANRDRNRYRVGKSCRVYRLSRRFERVARVAESDNVDLERYAVDRSRVDVAAGFTPLPELLEGTRRDRHGVVPDLKRYRLGQRIDASARAQGEVRIHLEPGPWTCRDCKFRRE